MALQIFTLVKKNGYFVQKWWELKFVEFVQGYKLISNNYKCMREEMHGTPCISYSYV